MYDASLQEEALLGEEVWHMPAFRQQMQWPGFEAVKLQQEITDAADGEDVLVVAHWDAVSGSIARLRPWAIADHVIHTGFTVSWREKQEGTPLAVLNLQNNLLEIPFSAEEGLCLAC